MFSYTPEKEESILMCLGNAERGSDSKNVISTFKNGSDCNFSPSLPLTSNMQPKLDGRSGSLGVWSSCITPGEGVCVFHTRTQHAGRFAFASHGNMSGSHKRHADTPKQGLHSPQMFLNLHESQCDWHWLKQARRPFGSLRPGLRR